MFRSGKIVSGAPAVPGFVLIAFLTLAAIAGCQGEDPSAADNVDLDEWPSTGLEFDDTIGDEVAVGSSLQLEFTGGLGQEFRLYRWDSGADSWPGLWHLIAENPGVNDAHAVRAGEPYGIDDFELSSPAQLVLPDDENLVGEVGRICSPPDGPCTRAFVLTD